jgi:hypothetical protein
MSSRSTTGERLGALFLLGLLIFNPPLLSIFAIDGFIVGVPVLYAYLFTAWLALVGLVALSAGKHRAEKFRNPKVPVVVPPRDVI